jgi:phosphoglycolate phosphatase
MTLNIQRYSTIIWDWNGTLLNDAWLCVDVMNGMLRQRGLPPLTLERYRSIFDFPVKDYYMLLGFDFGKEPFEVVGMEFMILYNERQKECSLHDGVTDVLKCFRDKGFRQCILSAREQNELRMETVGLGVSGYFNRVYGLDDHYAHGKTDVGVRLLDDLCIPKEMILFIGDTRHDAEVATELGIDCLLIPNGHHSPERFRDLPYPVIPSLSDLMQCV